jgi:hypothetical protein
MRERERERERERDVPCDQSDSVGLMQNVIVESNVC